MRLQAKKKQKKERKQLKQLNYMGVIVHRGGGSKKGKF